MGKTVISMAFQTTKELKIWLRRAKTTIIWLTEA